MTYINAAKKAESRSNWTNVIRITEVAGVTPSHARPQTEPASTTSLRAGLAWLRTAWQWIERKRSQQIASKRLRVAETISLGEKRTLSIVTVDGAQYLIGSSAGGVQLLTKLDRTAESSSQDEVSR